MKEKEYEVVLDSNISSLTDLENYKVKSSSSGTKYALQQFADVSLAPQLTSITRLDGERGRAVGCYSFSWLYQYSATNAIGKEA